MQRTIGIAGYAGSGKDTFAGYLARAFNLRGRQAHVASFADPIRKIAADCGFDLSTRKAKEQVVSVYAPRLQYSLITAIESRLGRCVSLDVQSRLHEAVEDSLEQFLDPGINEYYLSPRQFMQVLGTEGGRSLYDSFWVDIARADGWGDEDSQYVLLSDLRFDNELEVMNSVILVSRDGYGPINDHESEKLPERLVDPDYRRALSKRLGRPLSLLRVYNDGTPEDLRKRATQLAEVRCWNDKVMDERCGE